jgi:two-component system, NarL family, response regulator
MDNRRISIMIIEDHPMVRAGLAAMINTQPNMTIVAEAGSGEEAIIKYHQSRPDITLADLRLPGMSGVEIIREIRKVYPESRFIALTTYEGDEDIYQAIRAGVQGYLLKGMYFEELLEAITAVHAGEIRIPVEIAKRLDERLTGNELSVREMDVLRLIVDGQSAKQIAKALGLTESTVQSYTKSIYSKMGVNDRIQAAIIAIKRGLVHL